MLERLEYAVIGLVLGLILGVGAALLAPRSATEKS